MANEHTAPDYIEVARTARIVRFAQLRKAVIANRKFLASLESKGA